MFALPRDFAQKAKQSFESCEMQEDACRLRFRRGGPASVGQGGYNALDVGGTSLARCNRELCFSFLFFY